LVICANFSVFSDEETPETKTEIAWLSLGTNWGNYFDFGTDLGDFYSGAPGVNFSGYAFGDQKDIIGFFFNYGLLFPVIDNIESGYNPITQGDFIVGVALKYDINERLKLHFGIGPNFNMFYLLDRVNIDNKHADSRYSFGIGGDIGMKYDLTDSIYLDLGTTLSYDFITHRTVESTMDNWVNTKRESGGWIANSFIGVKPYLSIGINLSQKVSMSKVKIGKHKEQE
jgi:opacity protein-like surface antigen